MHCCRFLHKKQVDFQELIHFLWYSTKPNPMRIFLLACLTAVSVCFSLTNSDAQCPIGQTQVDVYIHTGGFSNEVYWDVIDANSVVMASTVAGDYQTDSTTYGPGYLPQHEICLSDTATYEFRAWDSFGDGWNGGTYEVKRACTQQVLADNNGISPNNNTTWFWQTLACQLQSTESFMPGSCLPRDLALTAVDGDATVCSGEYYYANLTVANQGTNNIDTAKLYVAINGDTVDTTVIITWNFLQSHTIAVGPFQLPGNISGINYPVAAWIDVVGDGDLSNNDFNGFSVDALDHFPWTQSQIHVPFLPTENSVLQSSIVFCDASLAELDSCTRLRKVKINYLQSLMPTPIHISLIAPSGDTVVLLDSAAGNVLSFGNVNFSDSALSIAMPAPSIAPGYYLPAETAGLAKLYGTNPNGTWMLEVRQLDQSVLPIALQGWSLEFRANTNTVNIGPDLSFCSQDSEVVTAVGGAGNYLWSTGSTSTAITVNDTGNYAVSVTDFFGCMFADSMEVTALDTILSGVLTDNLNQPITNAKVELLEFDAAQNLMVVYDSVFSDTQGVFQKKLSHPQTYIRAIPDQVIYPDLFPTYYVNSLLFVSGFSVSGNIHCDTVFTPIQLIEGNNPGGAGSISGIITACDSNGAGGPIVNETLLLMDYFNNPIAWTVTDANGYFSFTNLAQDEYRLWADLPGLNNAIGPQVSLNQFLNRDSLEICQYPDRLEWEDDFGGLGEEEVDFEHAFRVFPNPASTFITIQQRDANSLKDLILRNSLGQVVFEKPLLAQNSQEISLQGLAAGVYTLSLTGSAGAWHQSVIVR